MGITKKSGMKQKVLFNNFDEKIVERKKKLSRSVMLIFLMWKLIVLDIVNC